MNKEPLTFNDLPQVVAELRDEVSGMKALLLNLQNRPTQQRENRPRPATADAKGIASANKASYQQNSRHLQARRGACGIPNLGNAPVADKVQIHRQRGARGNLDERADGRHRCRKELHQRTHKPHHGRHPIEGCRKPPP